jgi:hypothetical protein
MSPGTVSSSTQHGTAFSPQLFSDIGGDGVYRSPIQVGVGSSAVRVTAGGLHSDVSLSINSMSATSLTSEVLTQVVYYDDPFVRVAVQQLDPMHNTPAVWRKVRVSATPSASLAALDSTVATAVCHTATVSAAGVCIVEVEVDAAWFASDGSLSITAGFADSGAADDLGDVVVHARVAVDFGQNIVAHLPARPVQPGESFEVAVYSTFDNLLETFTVDFEVGAGLGIAGFKTAASGSWSGTAANTGQIATLAYLRDGSALSKEGGRPAEHLLTMTVEVDRDFVSGTTGEIFVRWNDTSNVLDEAVVPDDVSMIVGRDVSSSSGSGRVFVEADVLRALFAVSAGSTIINTAVLGGGAISRALSVSGAYESGTVAPLNSGSLSCTGSDDAVFEASCSAITVRSEHSAAAELAQVTIVHPSSGVSGKLRVTVWAPQLPVFMSASINPLRRVAGWFDSRNCSELLFQHSKVFAFTSFWRGAGAAATADFPSTFVADVSQIVRGIVSVADSDVVQVTEAGMVVGVAPGDATLTATLPDGSVVGSVSISVLDKQVGLAGLDVVAVKSISATAATSTGLHTFAPFEVVNMNVELDLGALSHEGDSAHVVVDAVFSDGQRMTLGPELGLELRSSAEGSATFDGGSIISVPFMAASAVGSLIEASWGSVGLGECSSVDGETRLSSVGSGLGFLNVSLPKASAATVTVSGFELGLSPPMLVVPGSAAEAA